MPSDSSYLSGVIEGFYGRPWTHQQRLALLPRLKARGLNTYMYGPKDDIRLRARWRELYPATELEQLGELVRTAERHDLRFIYALAPGLDIRYSDALESERLLRKVEQIAALGVQDFVLLFDDIPHALHADDEAEFGTFAHAQATVSERVFRRLRELAPSGRRFVCPTDYCGRMAATNPVGWDYLRELTRHLGPDAELFWTGDEIVSEQITADSLATLIAVTGRKPIIWDNLFANDYDLRRAYLGPLTGRSADLVSATTGLLLNPNCQFELNEVAFDTLAEFISSPDDYDPLSAFASALRHWRPAFELDGGSHLSLERLTLLAELLYLPWFCGPAVEALLSEARTLLAAPPLGAAERAGNWRRFALEIEQLFSQLTELTDRDLLYALYGLLWEARAESRLMAGYLALREESGESDPEFGRPDDAENTYRLGFGAAVQALLPLSETGKVAR